MPMQIIRQDITRMEADAIVTSASTPATGVGGVDAAILGASGTKGYEPGDRRSGDVVVTPAGALKAQYIIHTFSPIWHGGNQGEREQLAQCYRSSLAAAQELGCRSAAFPLLASGLYGYPKDQAMRVAVDTISEFLSSSDMDVFLVIFDQESFEIGSKLYRDIRAYIDETYEGVMDWDPRRRRDTTFLLRQEEACLGPPPMAAPSPCPSLEEEMRHMDETFSEMLLRLIDEKSMSDAQCYRKANVDRRLFSKIRSNRLYQPSKRTVFAFAVSLELSLEETERLLRTAGFAISHSNAFDIIVEYFIRNHEYNVFKINEALFEFEQNLLGS